MLPLPGPPPPAMSLDRIPGEDNLYIGSAFALGRPQLLDRHHITRVLSVFQRTAQDVDGDGKDAAGRERLFIDVDDVEDEDLLGHFPRIVRFIDEGLRPGGEGVASPTAAAVYVHCAMGKSRSAAAVVAYLLWKYPRRFVAAGSEDNGSVNEHQYLYASTDADEAVGRALAVVREARATAEPNAGFMRQLALWWRMGCPADDDDAVARHPVYQRWLYQSDVAASVRLGRAPERLWFGDEAGAEKGDKSTLPSTDANGSIQLRCKKCRRVLASAPFIQAHACNTPGGCPHYFVEPLSWMRPALADGALEGRLVCPGPACKASLGRFAWQGFQCSCRQWVCPAFSLQRSRVDQVNTRPAAAAAGAGPGGRFGIRMPPGSSNTSAAVSRSPGGSTAENL